MNNHEALRMAAELLKAESTMVLATADGDGVTAAAPLFYWAEGLNVFWLSAEDSRHSLNIAVRPRVAVAVFASVSDWKTIRGVQMQGMADAIREPGKRRSVIAAYRKRFALGPELDLAIAGTTLYSFQPTWLRCIDNRRGFGFNIETDVGQ